jgi:hypothetical protein
MRRISTTILILLAAISIKAQDTIRNSKLVISGYAELYYSYGFNQPADDNRHSLNFNYIPLPNAFIRLKEKIYIYKYRIFIKDHLTTASDVVISTSLAVSF